MTASWANSGLDLHLDLDRAAGGGRLRASLETALREAVQAGRLAPGTVLPPSRSLAADLGIARNTVADAYAHLVAEGWLVARQGSATRVAERRLPADSAVPRPADVPVAPTRTVAPPRFDLRPGTPDVTAFPAAAWLACSRAALAATPAAAFGYGDPRGRPELRAELAGYLARARGVRTTPEAVVVCSGYGQALWLLCRVLYERGHRSVGMEELGHRAHRTLVGDTGLSVVSLEVDEEGARTDRLDELDALVLTPAHQFPLGVALSPARRTRIARWATESGAVVVEDDYDGEFRYDRRAVGALQSLAPDQVVYAGTASKTLAPGLRLAWLAVPPGLLDDLVDLRATLTGSAGVLDQLTLAEFIRSGRYDRHVRRTRLAYRRRRERLATALARLAPGHRLEGLAAGLHSVVRLRPGDTEPAALRRCAARDLAVDGLDDYAIVPGSRPPSLVVGWATPPPHAFTSALSRLTAALTE